MQQRWRSDDAVASGRIAVVVRLVERGQGWPNDLNGWRRLLRAYRVLGEKEKAQMVLKRIKKLENK